MAYLRVYLASGRGEDIVDGSKGRCHHDALDQRSILLHRLQDPRGARDGWQQQLLCILSVKVIGTGSVDDSFERRIRDHRAVKSWLAG